MVRTRTRNRTDSPATQAPPAASARGGAGSRQTIMPDRDEPEEQVEETAAEDTSTPVSRAADRAASRSNGRTNGRAAAQPEPEPERQASREVAPAQTRAMGAANGRNAFETYGQAMAVSAITGTLIKFNKGDWVDGDNELLDENMELVANMDQLMVGWIKWQDQRPVEQIMGPVAEGYQPQRRGELGDTNQDEWEVDNQGRPQDPWQFSNYIVMKEPGQDATDDNLYTFATSSKGGLGALGALCRDYGKEIRGIHADDYPIVALGVDSYMHREYGRTKIPTLTVVGWEPKEQFEAVASSSTVRNEEPEPAASRSPARGRGTGGSRNRAA